MASELGVQTIQHTNGTDALTIDSSGRVLKPNIVSFRATTATNISGQTSGIIIWDDTVGATAKGFHNIGNHYNTSTGKFVCPVDGVYQFSFQAFSNGTSVLNLDIRLNSEQVHRSVVNDGNASSYQSVHASINIQCSAGDEVYAEIASGAVHTNKNYSYFGGYLIG